MLHRHPMRSYDFWRVDVFADRPLEGNPLAVFPRAQGLTDEEMLAIAREMNLSETTFVLPSSKGADYRNRIFTPGGELPFAGHPSLGTAYVAYMEGLLPHREGVLGAQQEVVIGVLPLELEVAGGSVERVVMTQGTPRAGRRIKKVERLAAALGIRPKDVTATKLLPQFVSTGIYSLQVAVRSLDLVREMEPEAATLRSILGPVDPSAGAYVFAFEAEGEADLHARAFFPLQGIAEDPATGSAAGACGAYLAFNRALPAKEWFAIEQGIEVHHPSRIEVSVTSDAAGPKTVRVAGRVVPVMRGTLTLP